jgi:hypothetical protein
VDTHLLDKSTKNRRLINFADNRIGAGVFGFPNETVVQVIDGMCAPLLQHITLGWGTNNASTVMLQFMRLENSTDYWMSEMSINYNVSDDIANAAGM